MKTVTVSLTKDLRTIPITLPTFIWNKDLRKGFILYRPIDTDLVLADYFFETVINAIERLSLDVLLTKQLDTVEFNYALIDLSTKRTFDIDQSIKNLPPENQNEDHIIKFIRKERSLSRYFTRSTGGFNKNYTSVSGIVDNDTFTDISISGLYGDFVLVGTTWTYTLDLTKTASITPYTIENDSFTITAGDGTIQTIKISIIGLGSSAVIAGVRYLSESPEGVVTNLEDSNIFREEKNGYHYGDEPNKEDSTDFTNLTDPKITNVPSSLITPVMKESAISYTLETPDSNTTTVINTFVKEYARVTLFGNSIGNVITDLIATPMNAVYGLKVYDSLSDISFKVRHMNAFTADGVIANDVVNLIATPMNAVYGLKVYDSLSDISFVASAMSPIEVL